MIDFLVDSTGDLAIDEVGDIAITLSIVQAVKIRLQWFFAEWRLGPSFGFPYFEEVFVKNPNLIKIKHLLRDTILSVEGVTKVITIDITPDSRTRRALINYRFATDKDTFDGEAEIYG